MQYRNLLAIGAIITTSVAYAGNIVNDSKSAGPFGVETQVSDYLKSTSLYGTFTFNNLTLGVAVPTTTELDIKASIHTFPLVLDTKSTEYSGFIRYEVPMKRKMGLFVNLEGIYKDNDNEFIADSDVESSKGYSFHIGGTHSPNRNLKLLVGTLVYGKLDSPFGEPSSEDCYSKAYLGGFFTAVQYRFDQ